MDFSDDRRRIVEWVREQLIGPAMPGELQGVSPLDRYPCAVLFPVVNSEEGLDPADDADDDDAQLSAAAESDAPDGAQSVIRRRRYVPPSSVGLSFFIRGDWKFQVRFSAAGYENVTQRDPDGRFSRAGYRRTQFGGDEEAIIFSAPDRRDVMEGKAGVDVQVRPHQDGQIVTVSLFNRQQCDESGQQLAGKEDRCKKSLFEVELSVYLESGEIGNYPRVEYSLLSEEEQEQELQYRTRKIYAIGHGAAVDWREKNGRVSEIFSTFIPSVEVPQVTADVSQADGNALNIGYLSSLMSRPDEVLQQLQKFVSDYANWVLEEESKVGSLDGLESKAGTRIISRMQKAVTRMRAGIELIKKDSQVAQAFALANRAMLEQMRRSDVIRNVSAENRTYQWRPFQLAFLLTTIQSAVDENDEYRDVVDLIWFPTGGGKTEAYLGLVAFLVIWRRLKFPESGGGTTTLMRYTLRLLTAQQYLRAARIICALELIRRQTPSLGHEPITIGLWVGAATSPNSYENACGVIEKALHGNRSALQGLVLDACPWCGAKFSAPENYRASTTQFSFLCVNQHCDFGADGSGVIPCNVVDEALYQAPPTLLIATIDKFARLAWDQRTSAFFGKQGVRPPELVIQDELHLIAGALGSIAGLYEAALHTVLVNRGVYPKYIASTATIRMADDQVRRLYGKDVAVFPPPGLDCDDSYFARTVPTSVRPGRLYVGYLAPMLDRQHCMAPLAAALLVAPEAKFAALEEGRDQRLDAWWTQVVYHGSLKGVGNSHNAYNIDVRDLCQRLSDELNALAESEAEGDADPRVTRLSAKLAQLTSIATAEENARTFARLEQDRTAEDSLDVVLATNMVSVGLDVARLSLMIINGQPLTTAEYIQASSRVGRGQVPGIVYVNYYRDQARSLSHFENFRPYHESFYRFVEPTSVTPYTYQARMRALHAALVIAIRHSCPNLLDNNKAGSFDLEDERIGKVLAALKRRCKSADRERADEVAEHLDQLVAQWARYASQARHNRRQLDYQVSDKDKVSERLLHNFDDRIKGLWPTLQSMRHVENTALLKVL